MKRIITKSNAGVAAVPKATSASVAASAPKTKNCKPMLTTKRGSVLATLDKVSEQLDPKNDNLMMMMRMMNQMNNNRPGSNMASADDFSRFQRMLSSVEDRLDSLERKVKRNQEDLEEVEDEVRALKKGKTEN
jgi:septal ring factor EnvC (AmiA/AmiB activator)